MEHPWKTWYVPADSIPNGPWEAAKAYLTFLFEESSLFTIHVRWVMIMPLDIQLAGKIHWDSSNCVDMEWEGLADKMLFKLATPVDKVVHEPYCN